VVTEVGVAADLLEGDANYLIIAHPAFVEALAPYVSARTAEGYRVKIVDVTDLYASYGHGMPVPQAIRDYLVAADGVFDYRHVLLVGGATHDPNNHSGLGAINFLPPPYVRSYDMVYFTPADSLLADLDGDAVGDKSIGRWPVHTVEQLENLIAKTAAWRARLAGASSALLVADREDPNVPSFVGQLEGLATGVLYGDSQQGLVPWQLQRVYMDDFPSAKAARDEGLVPAVNGGVALTVFAGHGSPSAWTHSGLLNWNHVDELGGEGTLISPLACYTTYFPADKTNTLANRLMNNVGGAVAIHGAVTLGEAGDNEVMARLVLEKMIHEGMTLGEATLAARRELARSRPDVVRNWVVLGDPTLRLDAGGPGGD
jgi:hypothetical protein